MCCGLGRWGLREDGGNCLKHFKRGWNRKEGRRSKDFKKEWESWVKGWMPQKKGESGTPLRNYDVYIYIVAGK